MVTVLIALAVGEGETVVPLWFVVPVHAFFSTVVCVRTLKALFGWKRQVGTIPLCILTFNFSPDHNQGKVRRHTSPHIFGCASVDAGILKLCVVYDQLADVGDHNVTSDVVGSHYGVLLALQLFLPGDFRAWLP